MLAIKIIFFILISIIVAILAVENMNSVELSYYDSNFDAGSIQIPLLIVILCSLGLGFLIAWFGGLMTQWKLKSQLRKQNKTIKELTKKVKILDPPPESLIPNQIKSESSAS